MMLSWLVLAFVLEHNCVFFKKTKQKQHISCVMTGLNDMILLAGTPITVQIITHYKDSLWHYSCSCQLYQNCC